MDDGFHVDVDALVRAAGRLRDAVADLAPLAPDVPADAFGHARLAAGVAGFRRGWDAGVAGLTADAREIAARLAGCAEDYRRCEDALAGRRGAPPDPAAG